MTRATGLSSTITIRMPMSSAARAHQNVLWVWVIDWRGNFAGSVDSNGRYNAMQQPDSITLALAWAWAVMIEAIEVINGVVCRFFGTEVALRVVQAIEWMSVDLVVTTGKGRGFWAEAGRVWLDVRSGVSSDETKGLFEHLVDVIDDEKGAPSEQTRCALIYLAGSLVHEITHLMTGDGGMHLKDSCLGREENCEPLYALECRLLEALAEAFGVALCAAPCSADNSVAGAKVGACPGCRTDDGVFGGHTGYAAPIEAAIGFRGSD